MRRYQDEERSKLPWRVWRGLMYVYVLLMPLLGFSTMSMLPRRIPEPSMLPWLLVGVAMFGLIIPCAVVWLDSRMRRRIGRRVVDELGGGRLRVCLKCGYDLRGTPGEVCSECGASVYLSIVRQQ
jgi:hypothetical protein